MWLPSKGIDHKMPCPPDQFNAFIRNETRVCYIYKVSYPVSEDRNFSINDGDWNNIKFFYFKGIFNLIYVYLRFSSPLLGLFENIYPKRALISLKAVSFP